MVPQEPALALGGRISSLRMSHTDMERGSRLRQLMNIINIRECVPQSSASSKHTKIPLLQAFCTMRVPVRRLYRD